MKILFISLMGGNSWGGSEELWYDIANKAVDKGHTVKICIKKWPNLADKVRLLKAKGVEIIERKENSTFQKRIHKLGLLRQNQNGTHLVKIKDYNPDTILISQGATFDFFCFHSHLFNLIQTLQKPYYLISQFNVETGWLLSQNIIDLIININHLWSKFFFVSERNLKTAERQLTNKIVNAEVVSNPLNIKHISICEWPSTKRIQLACVSRYECSYKGQDILIETLAEQEFSEIDFTLNLFGSGPDREHLNKLISFYKLEEKVFLRYFVDDVDKIWKENHVLIMPSISEGTPLSLQEAMLKGRTALVTDVGGNSSLIIDGENGFLASTASIRSLKEKLLQLFSTSLEELQKMGENAFEKANKTIDFNSASKILAQMEAQK